MQQFVEAIYRYCDDGFIEYRSFPTAGRGYNKQVFRPAGDPVPKLPNSTNWYIGAGTRMEIEGKISGRSEHLYQFPAVWADLDTPQSVESLQKFPLFPTCVVSTSEGKCQAWWRLDEPLGVCDGSMLQEIVRGLAIYLNADLQATDLARVLRLPCTKNYKYDPPYPVRTISLNKDIEYGLYHFQDILSEDNMNYKKDDNVLTDHVFCNTDTVFFQKNNFHSNMGGESVNKCEKVQITPPKSGYEVEKSTVLPRRIIDFNNGRAVSIYKVLAALKDLHWPPDVLKEVGQTLERGCSDGECGRTVEQIIQSIVKNKLPNQRKIATQIRAWIEDQEGWWSRKDLISELSIPKSHWRTVTEVIRYERNRNPPTIVLHPTHSRMYRKYDPPLKAIKEILPKDLWEWDLKLPLDLHKVFFCGPKSVILLGGYSGHGKTTFCFNTMYENAEKYGKQIRYISTEVDSYHYSEIISAYPEPDRFKLIKSSKLDGASYDKFMDIVPEIDPDGITIIDYLELYEDVFRVGSIINALFDRLRTGILILAVQKKGGTKEAVGGVATRFKANLAVMLENGACEIVKVSRKRGKKYHVGRTIQYTVEDDWHIVRSDGKNFGEGDF